MGIFDFLFRSGGAAAKAAEELGAPIWNSASKEAQALRNQMIKESRATAKTIATARAGEAGYADGSKEYRKLMNQEIRTHKKAAINEWENIMKVREGQSYTLPLNSMGAIANNALTTPGIGANMLGGAMTLGAAALGGSAIYGTASLAMPNNVDVKNPIGNMVKSAGIGIGLGALYGASKGLVNAELAAKFTGVKTGAQMVTKALENRLVIGAIGAATVAGAGDINLTKPVNPVY